MGQVRIKKGGPSRVHKLLDIIVVLLGILIVMVLAFSGGALKYNAFNWLYGSVAPLVLVFFIVMLILIYFKFNEN